MQGSLVAHSGTQFVQSPDEGHLTWGNGFEQGH